MKLLLCSDFKNIGYKYLDKFLDLTKENLCLFIGYASDDYETENEEPSSSMLRLQSLNCKVIQLCEGYDFKDKIDLIFVRGGNTTKLIHLLKKFNQFEKIKQLAEKDVLYIGESAGSVLAGSDTEWTLRTEPYEFDLKTEFGENALKGYGFVEKMIFVHCSKYRFPFTGEVQGDTNIRIYNDIFYKDYLQDRKLYKKESYITLGNNQVYYQNGDEKKILTYDWSKIPFKKIY